MDIAKHELLFSKARLSRYITACKGDTNKAIELYKYNIQASQALYPVISVLEIALRNAIDRQLLNFFKDDNWLITQRNQFANHPNMVYKDNKGNINPDYFFSEKLTKAEKKLRYRGIPVTQGKLLAELTFGFWVKFFDSSSIKILKGAPLQALVNKPSVKLALVHSHLNSIVALRNRISHSEPICFNRSNELCLNTLRKSESDISEALRWIDSDLRIWADKINFFLPVYTRINSLQAI
jgi:hypothetical protein